MKRIIISIMAVAALAACTKSEVQFDAPEEIGFAPVASNITKSVAGYNGDTYDGVFPTDIDLYVFANAVEDTYSASNSGDAYFKNALFEWADSKGTTLSVQEGGQTIATTGAYAGNPTRYWPNVKSLVFAGYSDACGIDKTATTMDFATNEMTIPSYTQNNSAYKEEGANDLMWFPCDGSAYAKQANEVIAKMKHACSWITINVRGDKVTASNWILNSLVVTDLYHSGSAVCDATSAEWTTTGTTASEDYYTDGTKAITTDFAKYESTANNFIVIPQSPTEVAVTYTYVSQEAVGSSPVITLTETAKVSLDYDTAGTAWKSGVHYIYNITITATEILIDPVVVDWIPNTPPGASI